MAKKAILTGLLLLALPPGAHLFAQSCVCYYPRTVNYTCFCGQVISIKDCGGPQGSCSYCDDCYQYKFCCQGQDFTCSAGHTVSCTGAPAAALPGRIDTLAASNRSGPCVGARNLRPATQANGTGMSERPAASSSHN